MWEWINHTLFTLGGAPVLLIDVVTSALGLVCVFLAGRNSKYNFWVGYLYTAALFLMFWNKNLYASLLLQPVSLAINVLGHYRWTHPREEERSAENEKNLKVPSSKEARENGRKGGHASASVRRRKKTILQIMDALDRLPLNEIGKNDLKRGGLDLTEVDPDDLNGAYGIVAGMYIDARRGNQKAFESLARYRDQQRKDKLESEKLQAEIRKLKQEIEPSNDNDQVMEFIKAMTNGDTEPEAD